MDIEEPESTSQQAVKPDELDEVQQKVVKLVEVSSQFFTKLNDGAPTEETTALATEYFTLVKAVQGTLHEQVTYVTEALPPELSSYGAQRDFDVTIAKADVIHTRLQELRKSLGDA